MKKETLNKLCCPFDKADLSITIISITIDEDIKEGYLTCPDCNRIYPIVMGIPIMNPDEYREFQFELPLYERWQLHLKGKTIQSFRILSENKHLNKISGKQ